MSNQPSSLSCSCGQHGRASAPSPEDYRRLERHVQSLEHRLGLLAKLTGDLHDAAAPTGAPTARASRASSLSASPSRSDRGSTAIDLSAMHHALARIIGGVPSAAGEFDECALLEIRTPEGQSELCSGVLVGKRLVLSAAHCSHARSITVHLKCSSIDDIRMGQAESIPAKAFRAHPGYRGSNHPPINDIMLIILAAESEVEPVEIAMGPELAAAMEVELVGFGSASLSANANSAGVKRKVTVPLTSLRRKTSDDLDKDETFYGFESDSEFVAGKEGFDTCQGDSGGPVYLRGKHDHRVVAGLTSRYALNDGREPSNVCGSGGIYTRIDAHLDWITTTAKQLLKA